MQSVRFPIATVSIVILNATIFIIGVLSGSQTLIIQNYGFIPNQLFSVNNEQGDRNNDLAESGRRTQLTTSSLPQLDNQPHL